MLIKDKKSGNNFIIHLMKLETPLGSMTACATHKGVCLLDFTDRKILKIKIENLIKCFDATLLHRENCHLLQLKIELQEYYSGKRKDFNLPLHTLGTHFQKMTWKKLLNIPYGSTQTYKQHAITIGNPNAIRAVASANGCNWVSIIIPCHRLLGSDGKLTGYGGGLQRKQWLLDFEKSNI